MKVVTATAFGMCFGVQDALARIRDITNPDAVTIYGDLVHNESILAELGKRGFHATGEARRDVPATPCVLITAHGVSDRERRKLRDAGKDLIDTTCPLVRKAHRAALALAAEDRHVIVIGQKDHVEVRGLTGDLTDCTVLSRPEEVRRLAHRRLGVVCQTTTRDEVARSILARLDLLNPGADIRHIDTICRPTRDRQLAVAELLETVDALVVVGGKHSNNTGALVERARRGGIRAFHVQSPEDLVPEWFAGVDTVGLTAGTSTPAQGVADVHRALLAIAENWVACASGGS